MSLSCFKRGFVIFVIVAVNALIPSVSAATDNHVGREIIKSLQDQLYQYVRYTDMELEEKIRADLHEDYQINLSPLLDNISQNIVDEAIHWVDLDWDGKPELIFWTEGLTTGDISSKQYLFVIEITDGKPSIVIAEKLDPTPTRGYKTYRYSKFWSQPNKGKGFNELLGAVFSYMVLGGSWSTFVNFQIGYNRYSEEIYIDKFLTSFPIDVGSISY